MQTVVIGSGVGGLAAAIRLSRLRLNVTVLEANSYPGGKLSRFTMNGFRFDAGPSLFTMPELVDKLFEDCGKNPRNYFQYQKIKTVCNYFYPDGTVLSADADPHIFAQQAEKILGEPSRNILSYLEQSRFRFEVTRHVFLDNSLNRLSTYLHPKAWRALVSLPWLGTQKKLHQHNGRRLQTAKMVQLFDRFATYNGSNPYKAPATLSLIPHLEFGKGAFFPQGGMYSITEALFNLAQEMGVKFRFSEPALEVGIKKGRVCNVSTASQTLPADIVVCNMDVNLAYRKLLKTLPAPRRILAQEKSSSALIFYWGINRRFEELDLHNIFFSNDYEREFSDIFEKKTVCDDPTVYVNIGSKYCPEDAPEGMENWFVMVNVPANTGQDWDAITARTRQNVLVKLSKMLKCDIASHIVCEQTLDPRSIEAKTSSHLGALYGSSSNSQFSAFLRHSNASSRAKGLYFVGGSVHPGGGIPLCLSSAAIVEKLIRADFPALKTLAR